MTSRFAQILYRALDPERARAFYAAVLGLADFAIVPVPEAAAARGAPSHWLGAIGVDDVAQTLEQLVRRGATQLGPSRTSGPLSTLATVRDPGGALIGLTTMPRSAPPPPIAAWSHLDARDARATFEHYSALFGWHASESTDLGFAGVVTRFAWERGGASVGSFADVADRNGIHPQWIFHFHVGALDASARAVRAQGGVVLAEITTPSGVRVILCDDPQGGAFALRSDPEAATCHGNSTTSAFRRARS